MSRTLRLLDAVLARTRRVRHRKGEASGVLLVSGGGLGDTVLFSLVLPRFAELARAGEPVTVLLRRDAAKMAFLFPPDIRVLTVDFARFRKVPAYRIRMTRELHAARFRLVVSTDHRRHPLLDEAMVFACMAPETMAMAPRRWKKYDDLLRRNGLRYAHLFDSGDLHTDKVVRWTRFANWATGRTEPPPRVRIPATRLAPAAPTVPAEVLIQPFSAVPAKQLPAAVYRDVIAALPADHRVVFLGAPNDLDRNPEVRALIDPPRVSFDGSPFADLVPRLRAARLVISVDTALMHLAAAVGAPTLCLASAAYVDEIVPYAPEITPDNVRFLYVPMDCQGCLGACSKPPVDGRYPCVADLDPKQILRFVGEALDQS